MIAAAGGGEVVAVRCTANFGWPLSIWMTIDPVVSRPNTEAHSKCGMSIRQG